MCALQLDDKQLLIARLESNLFLAAGVKSKELKLQTSYEFFEAKFNVTYEELGCVGYNPETEELTALIKIKRPSGYGGSLCSKGSHEYVRFYVNYGSGYVDEGYTGVNVHDIADSFDCNKKLEKPIDFVVRKKINPSHRRCVSPFLPTVKAVLSWNTVPPANDPGLLQSGYIWGNVKEEQIQIKPFKLLIPSFEIENIGNLLEKAVLNPNVSLKTFADNNPAVEKKLADAKSQLLSSKEDFSELITIYKKADAEVESHRVGAKLLFEAKNSDSTSVMKNIGELFGANELSFSDSLSKFITLKGNTTYEELGCVGLDYHKEAFVATFKIKRNNGYGGSLCTTGSKEFVSFWVQEDGNCQWKHLGTSSVNVFDIPNQRGLSYSAILPYDLTKFKTTCSAPKVLKIRAILSWNIAPDSLDAEYWGNVKESYVQIPPLSDWDQKSPKIIVLGGVSVDQIDNTTGLTVSGAKIDENQNSVEPGSPFGGKITIHGISAPYAGQKYRVKITNMATASSYYVTGVLDLTGYDSSGNVMHTPVIPDADNYYLYQSYNANVTSKLALFSPGTNDLLKITIEHFDGSSDSHLIQMDNTFPVVELTINDQGNCTHFAKGDNIAGDFKVKDNYLLNFRLTTNVGEFTEVKLSGIAQSLPAPPTSFSRTVNVNNGTFVIKSSKTQNCGSIDLIAYQKTVWDSVSTGTYGYAGKIVCLKD